MGIPKFFRYTNERYPCISELIIKDAHVCEYDNLYLDMNGIIHMCSHPDNNIHHQVNEEKLYRDIFHYISYLFQIINPKKVFYLAIDGVAPRAKMNQQRCRRFQSVREQEEALKKAKDKGETVSDIKHFDSNCITPGTVFMARLHEQLRYFIKHKISTDRVWAKCKVILSGHETPGEGEHKIMDFIRYLRSQPDHDPNTRHCLYGLDADLIMLGLCTHERNFSILREEVIFKKNETQRPSPDEQNFYLLHLSLLKDYLEIEFECLKSSLSFEFDMEKLIDDWILMGFLVGNDFVPHLPNLMINNNALPLLYDTYKSVLPKLDGYINENGILNLGRFEIFLKQLSEIDRKQFEEVFADTKFFQAKTGRRPNKNELKSANHVPDDNETFGVNAEKVGLSTFDKDLQDLIESTEKMAYCSENDDLINLGPLEEDERPYDSDEDMFDAEFSLHKRDYYMNKLDYANVTEDVLRSQAEGYVLAIQWILNYYYQGCSSWSWYYPHHYAPFLSDIVNFKNMNITFELGQPFKPFEQLLAVLPVASKDLLPEPYHCLMTSPNSPILHYYPTTFETDLNGKLQQWEAVVLIPFIDEVELLAAMEPCALHLTEDEIKRNTPGPLLVYEYSSQNLGSASAPAYFPIIKSCHSVEIPIWDGFVVDPNKVVYGALENPYRNDFFPGVPTLKHLKFNTTLTKAKLKVFEFPSRNDSIILDLFPPSTEPTLDSLASLLGKIVWVGWPYLMEAKVLAITDKSFKMSYTPEGKNEKLQDDEVSFVNKEEMNQKSRNVWDTEKTIFNRHYMNRLGINVGEVNITVHAVNVKGYKYTSSSDGKLVHSVEWCTVPVIYPFQTILKDIKVAPIACPKLYKTIEEAFPPGDIAFIIMGPYYGSKAEVVDCVDVAKTGRIKVNMITEPEPTINCPSIISVNTYLPLRAAAAKCGISSLLFTRITSSVYVVPKDKDNTSKYARNINIGLCLKYTKTEKEVMGYTHKIEKSWQYSVRCIQLVLDYMDRFYDLFQKLESCKEMEDFQESLLFTDPEGDQLNDVVEWINAQSFKNYPIRSCSTIGLDPEELIYIYNMVDSQLNDINDQRKKIGIKVKPHVLFKADLRVGTVPPDFQITNFDLYNRVVNVSSQLSVPLGYKGTVVSIIQHVETNNSVKITDNLNTDPTYLVQFDKPFPHGLTMEGVPGNRFYVMSGFNLLNITMGCSTQDKINNKVQIFYKPPMLRNDGTDIPGKPSIFANNNVKNSPPTRTNSNINNIPPAPIKNSINNLRPNDGHNSAFANYTNPVKATSDKPVYTKIMQRPANFENPPSRPSGSSSGRNKEQFRQNNQFFPSPMNFENPPFKTGMMTSVRNKDEQYRPNNPPFPPPMNFENMPCKTGTLNSVTNKDEQYRQNNPPFPPLINFENPPFKMGTLPIARNKDEQYRQNNPVFPPPMNFDNPPFKTGSLNFINSFHKNEIINFPPQPKMVDNSQLDFNNDSRTELLKSLLKISDLSKPVVQNEKNNGHLPNYSIPPNNTQLPFPGKLIDKNPVPEISTNTFDNPFGKTRVFDPSSKHVVSTPFVPFQVTKKQKQASVNSQVEQKDTVKPVIANNDVSGNANNNKQIPKPQVDVQTTEKKKRVNRRRPKSRIAANFNVDNK